MSINLTAATVIAFDSDVKQEYQAMQTLRSTVTTRMNVTGGSYKFAAMTKGSASARGTSSSDVTPMDVSYSRPTATLDDYVAPEYTDIFDQAEVNFDERQELVSCIAHALGRQEDQIIIDAMEAGTYSLTPTYPAEGLSVVAAAGLTVADLRAASTALTGNNVDTSDRTVIYTANALESLLGETETTSSDYNTVKALVQGEIDTFMGFKHIVVDGRAEGGLAGTGGATAHAFAYHKAAVGYANGIDMVTKIDWVAQKVSWLTNGCMKAGAVIRENGGIVQITYDDQ